MKNENSAANAHRKIALVGNPNTGKSTLFNSLTGVRQSTGNFPGVTVAKSIGRYQFNSKQIDVSDLPGCYSLSGHSQEEVVVAKTLFEHEEESLFDAIVCVVNVDNLERNLLLLTQVLELEVPVVVALNMTDVAARHGKQIDNDALQDVFGVPFVSINATSGLGVEQLKSAVDNAETKRPMSSGEIFSQDISQKIDEIANVLDISNSRFLATRLFFDPAGVYRESVANGDLKKSLDQFAESSHDISESQLRFGWIRENVLPRVLQQANVRTSFSDQLDGWLTHRFYGLIIAVIALVISFQLVFWIADPASQLIDLINSFFANIVDQVLGEGPLKSLLQDGLISGVGGVLVFLPQILLIFLILGVLEDSGYLARAAFLMDKYLSKLGLSGVTTFPLLSSFACAIPGIMATRIINNEREKLVTILIAPLMSCSARLPVYVLLIAAFVPDQSYVGGWIHLQGIVMFAMYSVGIVAAIAVAWILKHTLLRFDSTTFVLELPTYKFPNFRNVLQRMINGGWAFVRDAGTMIVAVTIIVWALAYFPRVEQDSIANLNPQQSAARQLEQSYLGRMGKSIEPLVKPLGWDWRIGSAAIASFPAREVIVSTLGVIFGLGSDVDESTESLRDSLKAAKWPDSDRPLFTLPVSLSIMVFFALCAQCASTLAVIRRETNSYRWPVFTFVYMTSLAYVGAWVTFSFSQLFV